MRVYKRRTPKLEGLPSMFSKIFGWLVREPAVDKLGTGAASASAEVRPQVLRQAHEALATLTLRRLRDGLLEAMPWSRLRTELLLRLVQVVPSSRVKPLEESQERLSVDRLSFAARLMESGKLSCEAATCFHGAFGLFVPLFVEVLETLGQMEERKDDQKMMILHLHPAAQEGSIHLRLVMASLLESRSKKRRWNPRRLSVAESSWNRERWLKQCTAGACRAHRVRAMSGRNTRMAQWLDYRVRVTISDARMLVGTFMAFDKYMNVVLADCEEFRKIKSKGRKDEEKEVKRTLGFVVLRGETIVSLMAEAPPPTGPKKPDIQPGPGRGQVAGRGMPAAPLSSAPAGLSGPVRGVGGPAAIQMQPKVLTRARDQCVRLRAGELSRCAAIVQKFAQEGPDDVPLQHLRAAEQHLAALERWLRGEGRGGEKSQARAERIARELGLAPGKVFITNSRLCFYSNVLGVEVSFAAKWIQIASLRLEEKADYTTYPVLVSFKEPMDFDGKDVKTLDLRVFEFSDLGLLQKSATYFVGADLFGIYEESEVLSPDAKSSSPVEKPKPPNQKLVRTASMISPDEVLKELSMWELERRTNLFRHHWRAPYWPHDGAAKMKWVALEGTAYARHPFIPESVDEGKIAVPWLKVDCIDIVPNVRFHDLHASACWILGE
eukprot:Skav212187  [mRNA]  locus=scaffold754:521709:536586:- [translate_table: standard]